MHKCSIRGTFSFQKVILKNHFPTFILKREDFSSRLAMFSRNRESPVQRTTVLELWVHCVPPCPTLPTLRWVQVLVLRSLACCFPIVYSHAAIYRCSQVIACSDRSSESPCFGPKEMSRGGAGWGGALSQTPGLSQPISHLDAQSYTSCFFAMEARTNFEKRQSMRTRKREDSSELFGGRVEGGGGCP